MTRFSCLLLLALVASCTAHKSHNPLMDIREPLQKHQKAMDTSINLSASPLVLNSSGDVATIKLSGVTDPSITDIIAVYSPATADPAKSSPVKFLSAQYFDSSYLTSGSATIHINLVNLHSDVVFYFYKNASNEYDWEKSHLAFGGRSNVITFSNLDEPNQGHIAVTGKKGEVRISWASGSVKNGQYVRLGGASQRYSRKVIAKPDTYAANDLCGSPATDWGWKNPGYLQSAVITNLIPGKKYYYTYGGTKNGYSREASFIAPHGADADQTLQFIAIGDLGKYETDNSTEHWGEDNAPWLTTQNIRKVVAKGDAHLVLHVGDVAYAVGYSAQWDEFLEQIRPVAEAVPWMTLPGNHERDWINDITINVTDSGGECGIPYEKRFLMPTSGRDQPWYSFDMGPVHFVTMSTEHPFQVGSVQNDWIKKDLESVDRSLTPWVFFSGHRPMYIDSDGWEQPDGDLTVAVQLRRHVEPILVQNNVDVCFWGHHHSYQRSCHVNNEKCGSGPVHFVVGNAGFGLSTNLATEAPEYSEFVDTSEHGFSTVTVDKNNFYLEYHGNTHGPNEGFGLEEPIDIVLLAREQQPPVLSTLDHPTKVVNHVRERASEGESSVLNKRRHLDTTTSQHHDTIETTRTLDHSDDTRGGM
ncbi:putative inactive purple acid phosphatase 27-like [Planoprotostelium fungivorum]|uniref:Purple acid phosphatase n=1 Tax=Planoprotostelium fungivorum TaxID=1890364 RepID=A0A2P6N9W2_9EUKA|nr:putative inactive purple acid phosphatase 27-like [Planoprotostelium fungivorum]